MEINKINCLFCKSKAIGCFVFDDVSCCQDCFNEIDEIYRTQKIENSNSMFVSGKTEEEKKRKFQPKIVVVYNSDEEPEEYEESEEYRKKKQKGDNPQEHPPEHVPHPMRDLTEDELNTAYTAIMQVIINRIDAGEWDFEFAKNVMFVSKELRRRFFNPRWPGDTNRLNFLVKLIMQVKDEKNEVKTIEYSTDNFNIAYGLHEAKKNLFADIKEIPTSSKFVEKIGDLILKKTQKLETFVMKHVPLTEIYTYLAYTNIEETILKFLNPGRFFAFDVPGLNSPTFLKVLINIRNTKKLHVVSITDSFVNCQETITFHNTQNAIINMLDGENYGKILAANVYEKFLNNLGLLLYIPWNNYVFTLQSHFITPYLPNMFSYSPNPFFIEQWIITDFIYSSNVEFATVSKEIVNATDSRITRLSSTMETINTRLDFKKNHIVLDLMFALYIWFYQNELFDLYLIFDSYQLTKNIYQTSAEVKPLSYMDIMNALYFFCLPSVISALKSKIHSSSLTRTTFMIILDALSHLIQKMIPLIMNFSLAASKGNYDSLNNIILSKIHGTSMNMNIIAMRVAEYFSILVKIHSVWTCSIDANAFWYLENETYNQYYFGVDFSEKMNQLIKYGAQFD